MMCSTHRFRLKCLYYSFYELLYAYNIFGELVTRHCFQQQGELVERRLDEYVTVVKVFLEHVGKYTVKTATKVF